MLKPKKKEKERELTYRQRLFCLEFMKDKNATQAAIRAGYGENDKVASVLGSRLLGNVKVKAEIERLFEEQAARQLITADMILLELLTIARIDPRVAYDENGNLKDIKSLPPEVAKCISSIEVFEEYAGVGKDRENIGQTKKIRFWDKTKALETLAKHLKLLTDKVELGGKVDGLSPTFQNIIVEGKTGEELIRDLNNRLALQHTPR